MSEVCTSLRSHSSEYLHIFVFDDIMRVSSLDDRGYTFFPGENRGVASYQCCPLNGQIFSHLGLYSSSPLVP